MCCRIGTISWFIVMFCFGVPVFDVYPGSVMFVYSFFYSKYWRFVQTGGMITENQVILVKQNKWISRRCEWRGNGENWCFRYITTLSEAWLGGIAPRRSFWIIRENRWEMEVQKGVRLNKISNRKGKNLVHWTLLTGTW